jgi:peptidylprolyl isomerase
MGEEKAEEKAEEEAEEAERVSKGDFILVELTGRVEETGEVFETTDEETAKSSGIHREGDVYGPRLVVVGEGWVLRGLDKRLEGLKVGEETEIELPPEEAFGQRDPRNIRMLPYRVLRSKGITPRIGERIEVDGRTAVVRSVGAGRVQLDFNHPLAGRKIIYRVKVLERLEGDEERVKALIGRRFPGVDPESFGLKLLKRRVRITIPEEVFFAENLQLAKRAVALDIQRFLQDVETVEFMEIIKRR